MKTKFDAAIYDARVTMKFNRTTCCYDVTWSTATNSYTRAFVFEDGAMKFAMDCVRMSMQPRITDSGEVAE